MKLFRRVTTGTIGALLVLFTMSSQVFAIPTASPLIISQLKVGTGNQFITLYNSSDLPIDLSTIELAYFNNYLLSDATSSKLISLSGDLPAHGYVKINDGTVLMCYQQMVDSTPLGLSTKSGLIEVQALSQAADGSVSPVVEDAVAWSSKSSPSLPSYVQLLPADPIFLQRQADISGAPLAGGGWQTVEPQPTTSDPCALALVVNGTPPVPVTTSNQLLPGTEPPSSIVTLASDSQSGPVPILPAGDVGLMTPEITELMPNPIGTGNDASDEFIELYNPNGVAFDLSGFVLQVGTTTLHKYTFDDGTSLAPKSFTAFYSADTGLSLSNGGGQAKLFDPLGNAISQSDVYGTAKDGQAWALAKGVWYWTPSPTPNQANVVTQNSAMAVVSKTSGSNTATAASVKGATTAANGSATVSTTTASDVAQVTPIHPWTLALVALLALLYGLYEYRLDVANRIYQFRKHRTNRRISRS